MSSCHRSRRALAGTARAVVAGLAVLVSAACGDGVGPGPEPEEQLFFVSTRGDDRQVEWRDLSKDIYRMNADGTGVVNLTAHPSTIYRSLSLSPDGTRLAFNTNREGCYDLWVMNTDGTGPLRLTGLRSYTEERCNFIPRWSPDGSRIAFLSTRERNWSTFVMNADGSNPRRVSAPFTVERAVAYPGGWSPDGRVVVNYYDPETRERTYLVNADGTGLVPLLNGPGDYSPAWSPDGSRIAFISNREGVPRLYVMNADGSSVRKLSNLSTGWDEFERSWGYWQNAHSPWSPDGTRIAFTNYEGQNTSTVYVAHADGSGLQPLTTPGGSAVFNGWSPSGTRIAFTSEEAGSKDVYVVNADGTGLVNLTPGPSHESDALWLPRRR